MKKSHASMIGILILIAVTSVSSAEKASLSLVLNPNITSYDTNNYYQVNATGIPPYIYSNDSGGIGWNATYGNLTYLLRSEWVNCSAGQFVNELGGCDTPSAGSADWSALESIPADCPANQYVYGANNTAFKCREDQTGSGGWTQCSDAAACNWITNAQETDQQWTSNYTAYNDTWVSTTNATYEAGFQYSINGTIESSYNASMASYVNAKATETNASATGFCTAYADEVDTATNTTMKDYVDANDAATNTSAAAYSDARLSEYVPDTTNATYEAAYQYATNGTYYLTSNPSGYTNTPDEVAVLTAGKWCVANASGTGINCTEDAPSVGSESDPMWTANQSLYIPWAEGNLTYRNFSSMINCGYIFGNTSNLCTLTPGGDEVDPEWTSNYTAYNDTWISTFNQTYETGSLYATNGTYYPASNPSGYITESTNATYETAYQYAINGTIETIYNTSMKEYADGRDIATNASATGFCTAYISEQGFLTESTNQTYETGYQYATNGTYYLASNPSEYISSYTETDPEWTSNQSLYIPWLEGNQTYMNFSSLFNCGSIFGNVSDLCNMAPGAGSGFTGILTANKLCYANSTGTGINCTADNPATTNTTYETAYQYSINGTIEASYNSSMQSYADSKSQEVATATNSTMKDYVDSQIAGIDVSGINASATEYSDARLSEVDTATNNTMKDYVDANDLAINSSSTGFCTAYTDEIDTATNDSVVAWANSLFYLASNPSGFITASTNTTYHTGYLYAINGTVETAYNTSMAAYVDAKLSEYAPDTTNATYETAYQYAINGTVEATYNSSMQTYADAKIGEVDTATNTTVTDWANSMFMNKTLVTNNITMPLNYYICLNAACTQYMFANSSGVYIKG